MAFFLTDADRALLREMVDEHLRTRSNIPSRPGADQTWSEAQDYMTPETYIALPPEAGIPAVTEGVGDDDDETGSAECDIYKINESGGDFLLVDAGFNKTVHNLTLAPIQQDLVLVHRTKFGRWVAAPSNIFLFGKLDGSLSEGSSATMSIWAGDPLVDTTDNITVYDWFLGSGESIDSGKKVKVEFYSDKWYVTAAEC